MANVENFDELKDRVLRSTRPEIAEEISKEAIIERLHADAALSLQVNAALILCTHNPVRMLKILWPRIIPHDIDEEIKGRAQRMYGKIVCLALANIEGAAAKQAASRPH